MPSILSPYLDGVLDALDLDGDDREHLDGDAVELVEAAPGAGLGEALVDGTIY